MTVRPGFSAASRSSSAPVPSVDPSLMTRIWSRSVPMVCSSTEVTLRVM
jgi:hypothetical protein